MDDRREALLSAWIRMNVRIRGNRLLKDLSTNEVMACRFLVQNSGREVTASALCEALQLYKSQVNRLLVSLEAKGIVRRVPCAEDRRRQVLLLQEAGLLQYQQEHARVLSILSAIEGALGEQKTRTLAQLLCEAVEAVERRPLPEEQKGRDA